MHNSLAVAGIEWSDLTAISVRVLLLSVVVTFLGIGLLKLLAAKSVGFMLSMVVGGAVFCSLVGVTVIAWLMMASDQDRDVMIDLMAIAGLSGFAVAMFVGRRIITSSKALSKAVEAGGENGVYVPPQMTLPLELAELSDGLSAAHERLARSRTRERALEASRRELVAWVSHDLRTPLAGLRAMAEALEDEVVVEPREVAAYHTQIRREVDRLSVMIDDLFELSRIHAGTLRLTRRPVALEDMVAEVLASAEPVARAEGVRLAGSAVRGMPIYVDAAEFGRALRNLVTNAIRHTPAGGTVEVTGDVHEGMARFSVADACGGIPPEDLPRVFEVAFRGEAARTPGPQTGGGLGLSIARGIVEAHAGQIAVRNTGPGCQFLIRLPLARPAPQPMAPPAWTGPQARIPASR